MNQPPKFLSNTATVADMPTFPQQCNSSNVTATWEDEHYLCSDTQERGWQKSEVEGEAGRDLASLEVQTGDPLDMVWGFFCRGLECTVGLSWSESV